MSNILKKEIRKKRKKNIFITFFTVLIWTASCNSNNNDMSCICYIFENGLQTEIDETGLNNGAFTSDIKFRKECEEKSYFIDDDNYSSCQIVPLAGGSGILN
tara:strand:+ start:37 stop:342 length:306 start_codon:yes stop_codon:yes gene_type:complete